MAYQDYDGRFGAGWSHYGDYRQGQEYPSYYDNQPREPQGYRSSSEYISRPKYSKTDYITPKSRSSHRSGTERQRYRSAYMNTNEDYIEPPQQDDREDYIAPRKKDTHRRRHTGYERQHEQGRWGEDVEMKRSRQADDREYARRHDETRYYDNNVAYASRDTGISAQDQYTFSTNIPGSFPHEPEYSPPTKPIYTAKKTRFHTDPSRSRSPSVSSSSSYDSRSDIQSIPPTSQPKPTSRFKSSRTTRSKHPSTSKTPDRRSASPTLDSDADPERAYGSDFATLVDSSSDSSSSSRNARQSRQQRRRDSDITSLPLPSPSRSSHRQRYTSPAFGRPRTSTRKASRTARNEKVAGSDVESLHDESDVELYGSDVAVIESHQPHSHGTRSRNKQDGDAASDICSLPDKTGDEWRRRRASDVESLRREGRAESDVESGSGSEGRWDCDDGVELSSDEEWGSCGEWCGSCVGLVGWVEYNVLKQLSGGKGGCRFEGFLHLGLSG